ncbi:MAG: hypothetical protein AAF549_08620, partial [Pseudomonadota bacterium]
VLIFNLVMMEETNYEQKKRVDYLELCHNAIRQSVNNPSTVKMNLLTGMARKTTNNIELITQEFSAKNSFGLEKKMVAYCKGDNGNLISFDIIERDY